MRETDTSADSYAIRLLSLESVWWKRWLNVNAPYQWNLRRMQLGATLEVGCGIGRNLGSLGAGSIGIDHNASSVAVANSRGNRAFTTDEFKYKFSPPTQTFDSLLFAHVIEHLDPDVAQGLVVTYLKYVKSGARVVFITPQELGYRSDASHVRFSDFAVLHSLAKALDLSVEREYSFPFPRWMGHFFKYNEFVTIARRT